MMGPRTIMLIKKNKALTFQEQETMIHGAHIPRKQDLMMRNIAVKMMSEVIANTRIPQIPQQFESPKENEFEEVCGKIWRMAKPKGCSGKGDEFKNTLVPSKCLNLKPPYSCRIMLYYAGTNRDKGVKRK